MRAGVPFAALLTVGIGLSPDPGATLELLADDLAGISGSFTMGLLLAIVAGGIATWAAPRICHGIDGWVRHLPAGWPAHRRALLLAITAAELPVAMIWCALWLVAWSQGGNVELRRLLVMPVVLIGVSLTCMPGRRSVVVAAAGALTVGLALFGDWAGLALAVIIGLCAERLIVPSRGSTRTDLPRHAGVRGALAPGVIAFRAIGRRLLNAYAPVPIPLGVAWLFMRNNPGPTHPGTVRLAIGCAVALLVAGLVTQLATRCPPWRWARSLPWSAADRVRDDVLWVALHALVVAAVSGLVLSPTQAWLTALIVPLVSVRAAGALRTPRRDARTSVRVLGEGAFIAAWFSVTLRAAVPALILVWPAWRAATARDRNLDVSRWSPAGHLASGDPVSWRGA